MSALESFALGVMVVTITALGIVALRTAEEAWQPEPERPALARCEDCGSACHLSRTGRCSTCGSGSVWIAGAHS